ncbi:MAG TPA: hypothetical protein VMV88_01205 [Gallionella sp.]|nr:hypothetical protein [Gallionella sp.]
MPDKTKRAHLWQEITLTLAIKVIVLFAIWAVWFSSPEDAGIDAQKVASKIFSQQLQKEPANDAVHGTR